MKLKPRPEKPGFFLVYKCDDNRDLGHRSYRTYGSITAIFDRGYRRGLFPSKHYRIGHK
jgi:hypothetical protein